MEGIDDFIAGWVSGVAGLALTQPVDFVLTRLQSGKVHSHHGSALGMFRGSLPLFATVPVNNAMLMYGYGVGKSVGEAKGYGDSLMPVFLGGCVGGFVQSFLQSPVELLKVRLQLAAASHQQSTGALTLELLRAPKAAIAADAVAAAVVPPLLSKGLYATLLRDVVPHGVWFSAYEWSKRTLERRALAAQPVPTAEPPQLSVAAQLSAGAFAATAAWVVGYPAVRRTAMLELLPSHAYIALHEHHPGSLRQHGGANPHRPRGLDSRSCAGRDQDTLPDGGRCDERGRCRPCHPRGGVQVRLSNTGRVESGLRGALVECFFVLRWPVGCWPALGCCCSGRLTSLWRAARPLEIWQRAASILQWVGPEATARGASECGWLLRVRVHDGRDREVQGQLKGQAGWWLLLVAAPASPLRGLPPDVT